MSQYKRMDNASQSFKCKRCGKMFSAAGEKGTCPVCGFVCSSDSCRVVEASDEGY